MWSWAVTARRVPLTNKLEQREQARAGAAPGGNEAGKECGDAGEVLKQLQRSGGGGSGGVGESSQQTREAVNEGLMKLRRWEGKWSIMNEAERTEGLGGGTSLA